MNNIMINEGEISKIISKLQGKIVELENIYKDLNNKMKIIDESSEELNGDIRQSVYDAYKKISDSFPDSINQMNSLKIFLQDMLDSYTSEDKNINETIEKNVDNLTIK